MSDGLFFTLILLFFFVLWVASGGPTRPISFAGPFITPITNNGQLQTGYGPRTYPQVSGIGGSKIRSLGVPASTATAKIPHSSTFAGRIFLSHFPSGGSGATNPAQEYLNLIVSGGTTQAIDISGWQVVSTVTGASARIPQGVKVLKLGTVSLAPIIMEPGSTATISTGVSPVGVSFEKNLCTDFLSQQQHYSECVTRHGSDPYFLSNAWQIYLNRPSRLWKDTGDTIELEDATGKVVDSVSY